MNSSDALPREAAPKQSSIVAHPWFSKMIGLWFAALFGLCSLALAPELLERIVTTLGIDRIVPAAAPPLGQTARLLLALGMAGVGEIAGLVIGARLAARQTSHQVRQRGIKPAVSEAGIAENAPNLRGRDRHPDAPARKPLSAASDLGDDVARELSGIDTALRRRALASEAVREPRPFLEVAPLPGEQWPPVAQDSSEAESPVEPEADPVAAIDDAGEVFDLGAFDALPEVPVETPPESFVASFVPPPGPVVAPFAMPEPSSPPVTEAIFELAASAPVAEIATASLEVLGVVQLSERLALALQARRERRAQVPAVVAVAAAPIIIASVEELVDEPLAIVSAEDPPFAEPISGHEEPTVPAQQPPAFAPAPFAAPASFAPVALDDVVEDDDLPALARSLTMPRFTGLGLAAPEIVPDPIAPELERGLEILARRAPKPVVEPAAQDEYPEALEPAFEAEGMTGADDEADDEGIDELTDEVLEQGYSSLLAIGSGLQRPEAVRIEEPHSDEIEPVVIFPGQGARFAAESSRTQLQSSANAPFARPGTAPSAFEVPPLGEPASQTNPEETDRALRAALASLQRISGAR